MFVSRLEINVDIAPGRLWLRNMYRVHQRLCMAFPSAAQKENDPHFVQPFRPDGFQHVHGERTEQQSFLFRIDLRAGGNPVIVVQSALKPDWGYAFHNADYLLAAPPQTVPFEPKIAGGQSLNFRLTANTTRKIDTKTGPDGQKNNGQRVPVPADKLGEWLTRRAKDAGFSVERLDSVQARYVYWSKGGDDNGSRLRSVRYEGIIQVVNPEKFRNALMRGIGPGKAFGFGLLSVAPVKEVTTPVVSGVEP